VALVNNLVYAAHVGDSRLYLVRNGKAVRLTRDHTSAQFLMEQGALTAEQARHHPESHRLMRAVGIAAEVEPDVRAEPVVLRQHDSLILCSDGLYDVVDGREIAMALTRFPPQKACRKLVELANERGGPDNITCVAYYRLEQDSLVDRTFEFLSRPMGEVPVYIWLLAGAMVCAAAALFIAAFT